MKIIKKGKLWSIIINCTGAGNGGGGCSAELEIEQSDLYLTYHTDITCDTEIYYTIKCVACNTETDIETKLIPQRIKNELL